MKSIHLAEVSRAYGRTYALHRVTLTFEPGTNTLLLGANGAGKTTLLNILATLDTPTSGSVSFGDIPWKTFARRGRKNIGWVSHDALVYDDLTGLENLDFYADLYGVERSENKRWLSQLGLGDAIDQRVSTYSRGMRQRLSIARALIHSPSILLLDEPLTGLDRRGRAIILDVISSLRDEGRIVITITHELSLPDSFVDRVAILERGQLACVQYVDSCKELPGLFQSHA